MKLGLFQFLLFSFGGRKIMRIFRNKMTLKKIKLDEKTEKELIETLERDPRYQELIIL